MANKQSVRTSVDIPIALHRRLREAAARQGCSARQLILRSIEQAVEASEPTKPKQRLDLTHGLISVGGEPIHLTNEELYELIEFP